MKIGSATAVLIGLLVSQVFAQQNGSAASGEAWFDLFGGPKGAVVYPQYSWGLKTAGGNFGGYGFWEVAPHEAVFTNHLVNFTPAKLPHFSVWTETGGEPRKGTSFFQIGPRLNLHEVVPPMKKVIHHLFVVQLPSLAGVRPANTLIAGATQKFAITPKLEVSFEGYRRFFPGKRPDYAEYWLLFHPQQTKHLALAVFVLHHGNKASFAAGIRVK